MSARHGWTARGVIAIALVLSAPMGAAAAARCPERPACTGCGCKGGPGYRGPDGRCVGFKELTKVCGDPPGHRSHGSSPAPWG